MNVIPFCGNVGMGVVAISVLAGIAIVNFNLGKISSAIVTGLICTCSMFAGMTIALIIDRFKKKNEEPPAGWQKECREMAVSISRAVAERVSDRLVAKLTGLYNEEQRDAAFGDVNKILEEEISAVEGALESELRAAKNN